MNGARHDSLPCAGLAKEENGRVLGRHLSDLEEHRLECLASPDDLAEVELPVDIFVQVDVLSLEPVL